MTMTIRQQAFRRRVAWHDLLPALRTISQQLCTARRWYSLRAGGGRSDATGRLVSTGIDCAFYAGGLMHFIQCHNSCHPMCLPLEFTLHHPTQTGLPQRSCPHRIILSRQRAGNVQQL